MSKLTKTLKWLCVAISVPGVLIVILLGCIAIDFQLTERRAKATCDLFSLNMTKEEFVNRIAKAKIKHEGMTVLPYGVFVVFRPKTIPEKFECNALTGYDGTLVSAEVKQVN